MNIKNILFYAVKALNILMTVFALCICLAVGYIFFCNIVKMPVPTLGPFKLYVVLSDSMAPYMQTNDGIITVKTDAGRLKTGDVITFLSFESNTTITHRITEIVNMGDSYEFHTKGDNNNVEDSFVTPESKIIGKVAVRLSGFGTALENIQKKPVLIIFPILLFIILQYLLTFCENKLKPARKEKPKETYDNTQCYRRIHRLHKY